MADLTRFDFQALRFQKSDSVAKMSLEEIGQYILLLCEAWLSGKDASLPNDEEILARIARKTVSEKVLAMFPVVETQYGQRRQNEKLYGEWVSVQTRITTASEEGRRGNEIRWGANREPIATQSGADTYPRRVDVAQTKPNQSEPNQEEYIHTAGDFKFMSIRYKQIFGIHHSAARKIKERYHQACQQYGEDFVLEEFDSWARQNMWVKEHRNSNFGLNFFWPKLEIAWAARERSQNERAADPDNINMAAAEAEIQRQKAEADEKDRIETERRKQEEQLDPYGI